MEITEIAIDIVRQLPGLPGEALPFPKQLSRLDLARLNAYRDNLDFYQGMQWPERQRRRERRLTFNHAKAVIDKSASYVMSGISSVVDPLDGSPEAAEIARRAEATLREVYDANNLDQLDFDNEIDCSVLGDAAYKVTWDPLEKRVRVSAPDVQGLFVWWLGDDITRIWRVASRYSLTPDEVEMLFGTSPPSPVGRSSPKRQHTVVEVWTDGQFDLWLDDALLESRSNHSISPVFFLIIPAVFPSQAASHKAVNSNCAKALVSRFR